MASGLPVMINYEGWQKHYLEEYNCGFSSKNTLFLAEWILKSSQNKELYLEQASNARKLAEVKFDRKLIALKLQEKILQLIKNY